MTKLCRVYVKVLSTDYVVVIAREVNPLAPNILTLILPTCPEQNVWTVLGEFSC